MQSEVEMLKDDAEAFVDLAVNGFPLGSHVCGSTTAQRCSLLHFFVSWSEALR